jgi:hypothetical protein
MMKTYKETIHREALGVVASMMAGGTRYSMPLQVLYTIARIYEVDPGRVSRDIDKLLDSPKFMREAKGC